ncbi:MAG: SET domain-containing protein-lysine N-methyltransferase [Cyclobacteriaceae bacterium]|nr:SET domain-containing protein-lysine N-methyltransferase [Cyclobacteriaceae bacterium]
MNRNLIIKKSQLPGAGKGLFTTTFIKKGNRVTEYKGRIRKWKDVKHEDGHNGYLMYLNAQTVIDALPAIHAKGRYANDARGLIRVKGLRNNCTYVQVGRKCFIEATRNIYPGEEILVHYGNAFWRLQAKLARLKHP